MKTRKQVNGKLSKHFARKLNENGKIEDADKVYCVHCDKQFAYCGSNSTLTYHLQHKHPLQYNHVVEGNQLKPKEQPITNYMIYTSNKPPSDELSKQLNDAIAHWIASSGRPTAIVEDRDLQTVLRIALQNISYTLPTRRTIDAVTSRIYNEKLLHYKKVVYGIGSIAITSDFWTSNNNQSYCGITGHWIDSDWKLTSVILECFPFDERHTAENVAYFLRKVASEWTIEDKISCIVTDNARNMVAAVRQADYNHIPCIAHCIQRR